MRNGIKLQVQKAILTLKTKKSVLKQKEKASNMEDEILEQSNEMYKNQLLKMSDLLMQEAKTRKAKAEAIMAKYEVTIAAAKLKLALGETILDDNKISYTNNDENNIDLKKLSK
jgi:outer membrane protein TolC